MFLDIVKNSFWGLRREYFLRNLLIGSIFGICLWFLFDKLLEKNPKPLMDMLVLKSIIVLNTIFYPYAKFLYDYAWEFVLGNRTYIYSVNPITLYFKLVMRVLCWCFAIILVIPALPIIYFKNR